MTAARLPPDHPARGAFGRLHALSELARGAAALGGILVVASTVKNGCAEAQT